MMAKYSSVWQIWCAVFLFLFVIAAPSTGYSKVLELNYDGFTVWLDCNYRGAIRFHYTARADNGSHKRLSKFYIDPKVPSHCQQSSTASYKRPKGETRYDRGHLVPANHLDGSKRSIAQSNFMANVLPQAANMNRGAWLLTEEIVECYRDIHPLEVWGGVVWGDNSDDDYFVISHDVRTPDAFWKVIVKEGQAIAWLIPNSAKSKRGMLDNYLVSIEDIESISDLSFDVPTEQKMELLSKSWVIPVGCDKG